MQRVDFTAVRKTPIEAVLAHYGLEGRRQGNMIVLKQCPLPSHMSKELDTFKASVVENLWQCWSQSCRKGKKKGGDVIDLVCEVEGLEPLDAAKKLAEMGAISIDKLLSTNETPIVNKPLGWTLQVNPEHPMIQDRGISVETALSYGVGYYEDKRQGTASMHQRIIFPLHEDSQLVGYIGRATIETQESKWKLGVKVRSMLFGLDRCDPAQPLILTESCWAPLWFSERGRQAAALIAAGMTDEQERKLAPFTTIVVAMDCDDAGREAAEKIIHRLKANHTVTRAFLRE